MILAAVRGRSATGGRCQGALQSPTATTSSGRNHCGIVRAYQIGILIFDPNHWLLCEGYTGCRCARRLSLNSQLTGCGWTDNEDGKSTRLNCTHTVSSYDVFCYMMIYAAQLVHSASGGSYQRDLHSFPTRRSSDLNHCGIVRAYQIGILIFDPDHWLLCESYTGCRCARRLSLNSQLTGCGWTDN